MYPGVTGTVNHLVYANLAFALWTELQRISTCVKRGCYVKQRDHFSPEQHVTQDTAYGPSWLPERRHPACVHHGSRLPVNKSNFFNQTTAELPAPDPDSDEDRRWRKSASSSHQMRQAGKLYICTMSRSWIRIILLDPNHCAGFESATQLDRILDPDTAHSNISSV
jgi:hypothetical protein